MCDIGVLLLSLIPKLMKLKIVTIHRMDNKGEVKCIKFSLGNKILAVQRTPKSVVSVWNEAVVGICT